MFIVYLRFCEFRNMARFASIIFCRGRARCHCLFNSVPITSLKQVIVLRGRYMSTFGFAEETASRLQELGVSINDITNNPQVSRVPFNDIEHRLNYCAEGGIRTSISSVTSFDTIVKSSIPVLKDAKLLPNNINVIDKLLESVNFDGPYPSQVNPNGIFQVVHFQTLSHCMQYSFGYSFPNWNRYIYACLKFSLYNIEHLNNLGLGWQWIRNHPSLVCFANPYNLKKLCEVEKMYTLPICFSNLLRRDPNIAYVDYEDFIAIFFILMKKKICRHDLNCVKENKHFLIDPDVLDAQLKRIVVPKNAVDFNLISLLYKFKYIEETPKDKSWDSFKLLIERRKNPFIKGPEPTPGSWRHEMKLWFDNKKNCLEHRPCRHEPYNNSDEMDDEDENDEDMRTEDNLGGRKRGRLARFIAISLDLQQDDVERKLRCIPLGLKQSTVRAMKTLKFLQQSGFRVEEIAETPQLLIYPRHEVGKALRLVLSNEKYGSPEYRNRHLHLCLYHILMKYDYRVYQPPGTT